MSANSLLVYLVVLCFTAAWIYIGSLATTDLVNDLPHPDAPEATAFEAQHAR